MVRIGTPPAPGLRAILASMTGTLPASALDPFSEEFLRDPYPAHEELREAGPAVLLERYGVWAMARHEPVRMLNNTLRGLTSLPVRIVPAAGR
jgi:cytochrome P450